MDQILQIQNLTKQEFISIIDGIVDKKLAKILEKPKSKYLTIKEACEELRVCDKTMRNYIKEKDLKPKRTKGKILIPRESFEKLYEDVKNKHYKR
ncbi:helix-turn-helix domain-containing protein [Tenacibaculum sp. 190524A02b]|uniref:helix-turn-helix domain-containing protein n=1 Tax=Tenacibaculum vairaonense TaxID=3137860 RepID=UPI0031FB263C